MDTNTLTLRVVNVGDKEFRNEFEHQWYSIQPGSETLVPRMAVHVWFGDPEARDIDQRRRPRFEEWERLNTMYGAYSNPELWEQNRPHVEVYDMAGNRVITVAEDPSGSSLGLATESEQSDVALLQAQIAALTARLDSAEAENAERGIETMPALPESVTADSPSTPDGPPVDEPTKIPVGPSNKRR